MSYVDGFIVAVPKKKIAVYLKMARLSAKVWREHGAVEYREAVADDVKKGKLTSFPRSVLQKPSETVIFSWIVYKSRKHRDAVLKKVMKDKRLQPMMKPGALPFDGKRMIYGGFKVAIELP
jgi:uncharacterized protein YbaA (DUF1428 family)